MWARDGAFPGSCSDDRLLRSAAYRRHRLGVLDDMTGIELLRRWCDRDQCAAVGHNREQRDHELDPVVEHDHDVVASLEPAAQIAGKGLAALQEVLARDREPVLDDQHRPMGVLETALVHDLDDCLLRHGTPFRRHVLVGHPLFRASGNVARSKFDAMAHEATSAKPFFTTRFPSRSSASKATVPGASHSLARNSCSGLT